MNKEERVKIAFEALSKIVGFEIKPDKAFYIISNNEKEIYYITHDLTLMELCDDNTYRCCIGIVALLNGQWNCNFEEIKEPLLTDEEKE